MEPILRTEHLTFTYPGEERPTLGDLSLEIARGVDNLSWHKLLISSDLQPVKLNRW